MRPVCLRVLVVGVRVPLARSVLRVPDDDGLHFAPIDAPDAAREQPKTRELLRDYLATVDVQGTLAGGQFDEQREIKRRMMVYVIREENMEKSGDHVNTHNTISRID